MPFLIFSEVIILISGVIYVHIVLSFMDYAILYAIYSSMPTSQLEQPLRDRINQTTPTIKQVYFNKGL